jgi:hypothetical protein
MTAKKLENLLNSGASGGLQTLIRTARDMEDLTAAVRAALAPELAEQVIAANLRDDRQLVIICPSSAWASRVRFEAEALLAAARKAGFDADSFRVSVQRG